jgi:xanthine dehydrogenase accessory factor
MTENAAMEPPREDANSVIEAAARWRAEGRRVALATVVSTWGSSPRPVGSQLAADEAGEFVGSVSGGCVESAVIAEARAILGGAPPKLLAFGVSDEQAWEVGLACGGKVEVFVQSLAGRDEALRQLRAARRARHPALVATDLSTGDIALVAGADAAAPPAGPAALAKEAARALADERSRAVECDGRRYFLQVFAPPRRLVLVGAVHIAQALVPMAVAAGYEVFVIDPRSAFSTASRFPGVTISRRWPAAALAEIGLDRRSAVVTLTHDPKLDDPALEAALRSEAFYIGALGSRKTHAARLQRLRETGFTDPELARIHGPVGLSIGAVSPAEIAVSILAELTQTLRQASSPPPEGKSAAEKR